MTETHRAYGKLREIIERRGGTMIYERKAYQYGAWVISLDGREKVIKARGDMSFPELDRLYVPKIVEPRTWEDRHDKLLDDAEDHFLLLLK